MKAAVRFVAVAALFVLEGHAGDQVPDESVFGEFASWAGRYVSTSDPLERQSLEQEGQALALRRRDAMTRLIQSEPQRALQLAVPAELRQALPGAVTKHVELHVSGRGDLNVLVTDDFDRGKSETHRTISIGGKTYRAFVYGRRLDQTSAQDVPLRGIVLDNLMAVHETATRRLQPEEALDPRAIVGNPEMLCPVCKRPASKEIAAEVGGAVYFFDCPEHVGAFDNQLLERDTTR